MAAPGRRAPRISGEALRIPIDSPCSHESPNTNSCAGPGVRPKDRTRFEEISLNDVPDVEQFQVWVKSLNRDKNWERLSNSEELKLTNRQKLTLRRSKNPGEDLLIMILCKEELTVKQFVDGLSKAGISNVVPEDMKNSDVPLKDVSREMYEEFAVRLETENKWRLLAKEFHLTQRQYDECVVSENCGEKFLDQISCKQSCTIGNLLEYLTKAGLNDVIKDVHDSLGSSWNPREGGMDSFSSDDLFGPRNLNTESPPDHCNDSPTNLPPLNQGIATRIISNNTNVVAPMQHSSEYIRGRIPREHSLQEAAGEGNRESVPSIRNEAHSTPDSASFNQSQSSQDASSQAGISNASMTHLSSQVDSFSQLETRQRWVSSHQDDRNFEKHADQELAGLRRDLEHQINLDSYKDIQERHLLDSKGMKLV